jgi:TPR repeat protein
MWGSCSGSHQKTTNCSLLFVIALSLSSTVANAADSMLRVACDDAGAEVLINGKFRGECPIDLQVPAVEANAEQAAQWFRRALELCRKAVENGDSRAMIDLGSAYMHGYGVPEDRAEALMWYPKARDNGNHDADLLLQLYEGS